MVMMLVLMVVATAAVLIVVVMVMMLVLMHQLLSHVMFVLHSIQQLRTCQFTPRCSNQGSFRVTLPEHFHSSIQLRLGNGIRTGQDDGTGSFHLIVIELAKVLHIHLNLACIHNCNGIAQGHMLIGHLFHGSHHIGQLAHAGRLDYDPIRVILCDDLGQRLAEITH